MNTCVMGLQPLYIFSYFFNAGSDFRRQILMSPKVGSRAERVKAGQSFRFTDSKYLFLTDATPLNALLSES